MDTTTTTTATLDHATITTTPTTDEPAGRKSTITTSTTQETTTNTNTTTKEPDRSTTRTITKNPMTATTTRTTMETTAYTTTTTTEPNRPITRTTNTTQPSTATSTKLGPTTTTKALPSTRTSTITATIPGPLNFNMVAPENSTITIAIQGPITITMTTVEASTTTTNTTESPTTTTTASDSATTTSTFDSTITNATSESPTTSTTASKSTTIVSASDSTITTATSESPTTNTTSTAKFGTTTTTPLGTTATTSATTPQPTTPNTTSDSATTPQGTTTTTPATTPQGIINITPATSPQGTTTSESTTTTTILQEPINPSTTAESTLITTTTGATTTTMAITEDQSVTTTTTTNQTVPITSSTTTTPTTSSTTTAHSTPISTTAPTISPEISPTDPTGLIPTIITTTIGSTTQNIATPNIPTTTTTNLNVTICPTITTTTTSSTTTTTPSIPTTTSVPSTTNPTTTTTTTPTTTSNINFGLKLIKLLYIIGRRVMYNVFRWGTPTKDPQTDLISYLNDLQKDIQPPSTANCLHVSPNHLKFKNQRHQMQGNPSCDKFDITLLFTCIKLACEDVKDFHDPAWITDGDDLENSIYMIKEHRNKVMHEILEMTELEFLNKWSDLQNLFISTLKEAHQRYEKYGKINSVQAKDEIQEIKKELNRLKDEPIGCDDLLMQCGPELRRDLIEKATEYLKMALENDTSIDLMSFLIGKKVRLQVKKIFTKIKVILAEGQKQGKEFDYEDLLEKAIGTPMRPKLLIAQGLAGSGKTTLVKLVIDDWLAGGQGHFKKLDCYQLLLRVQCRDSHLSSFLELLENLMLHPSLQYGRDILLRLVKQCSLLLVVDGLDERNTYSNKLVQDILDHLKDVPDCTILCTTRPEALQDFLLALPGNYEVTRVELVGIPQELRVEFVRLYLEEIKNETSGPQTLNIDTSIFDSFMIQVEKEKFKEHYRLPLNLVIRVWLFYFAPNLNNADLTQTELYHHSHKMFQKKLDERLANNEQTRIIEHWKRVKKVKDWLPNLYRKCFEALSNDELTLRQQDTDDLKVECQRLGLPQDEILASFLSMRITTTTIGELEQQYSAPHKGIQEYHAAKHVVYALESRKQKSIRSELKDIMGKDQVSLRKYQNMLQQVVGLMYYHKNTVPASAAQEVVQLLSESGINSHVQWLDVLGETQTNSDILVEISKYFSNDRELEITDGNVKRYMSLLPHLSPSTVRIELMGEPSCLNFTGVAPLEGYSCLTSLLPSLARHTCCEVLLWRQFRHPNLTQPTADWDLQCLSNKGGLEMFAGQVSWGSGLRLPDSLTNLWLAVADDRQAMQLPKLKNLENLEELHLHVTKDVQWTTLSPLPDLEPTPMIFYFSDVGPGMESETYHKLRSLMPESSCPIELCFPRSTLGTYREWMELIRRLESLHYNIDSILIPANSVNIEEIDKLNLASQNTLTTFDFKAEGW